MDPRLSIASSMVSVSKHQKSLSSAMTSNRFYRQNTGKSGVPSQKLVLHVHQSLLPFWGYFFCEKSRSFAFSRSISTLSKRKHDTKANCCFRKNETRGATFTTLGEQILLANQIDGRLLCTTATQLITTRYVILQKFLRKVS